MLELGNFIEAAYAIGGAWAVATAVLGWTVAYLYRAREKEHRERLREARENAALFVKLLEQASRETQRPPPRTEEFPWYDDEDDEPTLVTRMRHEHVRSLVTKYLEEVR